MMLVLQTPEEEEAVRQGKITAAELGDRIRVNNLNPEITVAVDTSQPYGKN